ncbi:MAG: hypothetical protein LBP35_06625 [Candidatus Ancillula trichonymphae]|nr:hypothetical protein [Candidatus Ancillula trichonymphae]
MLSKQTRRKRAFYLLFESIVRGIGVPELLDLREQQFELKLVHEEVDAELKQFLLQVYEHQEEVTDLIMAKCRDNSRAVGNSDLAILAILVYEMLYEKLDLPITLTQGAALSEVFGATDESPSFVHAVVNNIHADLVNEGK